MKAWRGFLHCPTSLLAHLSCLLLFTASPLGAQNYEDLILSGRDYKLEQIGQVSPSRVMDFRFNANPAYTEHPAMRICGECLCITGAFTGKYPKLGTQLTWYTPTSSCEEESQEFQKEAEIAANFLQMSQLERTDATLRFSSKTAQAMVFRLRRDMESCLNWFDHEGVLAAQNACTEPARAQVYAPKIDKTVGATVPASGAALAGISRNDAEGFLFSACPVDTQPTVPFNEEGFQKIRARDYECR